MNIGGLGGSHNSSDHQVTRCIHDHHESPKDGGMSMKASAAMKSSAANTQLQQDGLYSLSAWVRNMLGSGKGFLLNFWDGGQADAGSSGDRAAMDGAVGNGNGITGSLAAVAQAGNPDLAAAAAATAAMTEKRRRPVHGSHSFSTRGDAGVRKQTFWQKMRARFQDVSGRLNGRERRKHYGFQAGNASCLGQEKKREDLRSHSRTRRDTVDISCARTEESYLMDSYDRRGEYATLTTTK